MSIEDNIRCRSAAEELAEFLKEYHEVIDENYRERFWNDVRSQIDKLAPPQPRDAPKDSEDEGPMSDAEARRFGQRKMPFGEFRDERIDCVPLDRLSWYADQSFSFTRLLRRYLASSRVQAEQR